MKKFFKIFKNSDIFGHKMSLSFKKDTVHKTICGGLFSIALISFMLGLTIFCFVKLVNEDYKESYKSVIKLTENFGSLPLNGENFMIAIKFDQEIFNNWTLPFINISLVHATQYRNETSTYKIKEYIKLEVCQEKHFPGLEDEFYNLKLTNALCPELNANLSLTGSFVENAFSYFNFVLKPCQDTSKCQNNSILQIMLSKIDKLSCNIYLTNNNVDEFNIMTPIKRQITSDIHFIVDLMRSVYRSADIFFSEVTIKTDKGYLPFLFQENQFINNFTFENELREQAVFYSVNNSAANPNIADFYFRKSQTAFHYKRNLGNLLATISYLGGIWSSLSLLCYLIISKYDENSFFIKLSNKLYNFPSQKRTRKKKTTVAEILQYEDNTHRPKTENKIGDILSKIREYLNFDRKLRISFFDMIKYMIAMIIPCHTPSEKNRLFQESKKNLIADLDLYNILRRLQDFDKIKNLLFSKDQIKILNFSPKPNVSFICDVNETAMISKKSFQRINTTRFINNGIEYDSMHIFEDLISSWKKLKNDFQNNKISQDLAKLFGQQFESSFDGFDDFLHEKQQGIKDDREENVSDLMESGSVKNEINSIEQFVNVKGKHGTYLCDEN